MSDQKLIFVCSPWRSDPWLGAIVARRMMCKVLDDGNVPVVPQLYLTQVLNDNVKSEREIGLRAALRLLEVCQGMLIYADMVTSGMLGEIRRGQELGLDMEDYHEN